MAIKRTTAQFIQDARRMHGPRFDYSKAKYSNSHTKLEIICHKPGHGSFWQRPDKHLRKGSVGGCPKCNPCRPKMFSAEVVSAMINEYWAASSRAVCQKYGVSPFVLRRKVKEAGFSVKIGPKRTTLPEQDQVMVKEYLASAGTQVRGTMPSTGVVSRKYGVSSFTLLKRVKEAGIPVAVSTKRTTAQFVEDARRVHGSRYDYSKAVYNGRLVEMEVICPKPGHGSFLQTPNSHVSHRVGCPECNPFREKLTGAEKKILAPAHSNGPEFYFGSPGQHP